ncbi:hypothetical protein A2773_06670 [Candidatus Gottesmanbacteria bacterium RIFCSPHIGHO2_01_FULL_39_10]|uniref:Four helix bundle protein n=1 Tax=Candidatus Gottesmanbacteria bacterium RIFCSPHIGHO2_01_FULL_39_10 TaxID=1798375 RepID=A0A1F5ZQ83_9BACT|nr:MAG: hypothetical protein A2773_06670 [Candidatus Gottesmanbacteria bacterium RIFCSPHIGHO2_01_FULL_39_10]
MKGTFDITKRCFDFAVLIVQLANKLPRTAAGFAIANQIIRSGTSVGANVVEAQDAISKKEFIRIMFFALKECRETLYWLSLILETKLLPQKEIEDCLNEGKQLRAILATIVRKSKINS